MPAKNKARQGNEKELSLSREVDEMEMVGKDGKEMEMVGNGHKMRIGHHLRYVCVHPPRSFSTPGG